MEQPSLCVLQTSAACVIVHDVTLINRSEWRDQATMLRNGTNKEFHFICQICHYMTNI